MSRNLLTIVIVASIFRISASENNLQDIKKILNELQSLDRSDNSDLEYIHKLHPNTPSHHRHGYKSHHKTNNPNLMNIQTMNLYMKPKKHNLDRFLRMETDKMCKETGRCGCTGTRCGDPTNRAKDEVADEIDEIVNEVNKQIARDDTSTSEDSDDTDGESNNLRCDGDRCGYDRYSNYDDKQETNNDGVDIVILNAPNSDEIDENTIQDLTRSYLILDKDESNKDKSEKAYILDLNVNPTTTSDINAPTPDDFVSHYKIVRDDVIKQLSNYIQNNTPIPLKHLQDKQKQLLKTLKMIYKRGLVKEDDLKSEIVDIVFGEKSGTKIYPHNENNDNIYVPRWHYNSLLQYKKDLRSKRLLPLTTQQRERLLNKQTKTIPKLAWRRNLDEHIQKYGIPFNLEAHGLGQINP